MIILSTATATDLLLPSSRSPSLGVRGEDPVLPAGNSNFNSGGVLIPSDILLRAAMDELGLEDNLGLDDPL